MINERWNWQDCNCLVYRYLKLTPPGSFPTEPFTSLLLVEQLNKSKKMSRDAQLLPLERKAVPRKPNGLPLERKAVPRKPNGLPLERKAVPRKPNGLCLCSDQGTLLHTSNLAQ